MTSTQTKSKSKGVAAQKCTPITSRKKSVRNLQKEEDVELPPGYKFLVYFECDNSFDIVKADHGGWPNHLSNKIKLSMKYEDVPFKSDKNPKHFINGLVITNGPKPILKRLGDYMNMQMLKGIKIVDMDLTQNFETARQEVEQEISGVSTQQSCNKSREVSAVVEESDEESWADENDEEEADMPASEVLQRPVIPRTEASVPIEYNQMVYI